MFEMVEFSNFQNVSLVPFPWSATTAKFFGRATHTHHLLFFCKLTSVKPWSPPSTQTGYVKGISLMAWNSIYVLITTKCLSSSEASLLNSRREYAAVYLTSPHGYLTDHFKFSVSKTEHLISSPSKPSLATAFTISADDSLKFQLSQKSWKPHGLPSFSPSPLSVRQEILSWENIWSPTSPLPLLSPWSEPSLSLTWVIATASYLVFPSLPLLLKSVLCTAVRVGLFSKEVSGDSFAQSPAVLLCFSLSKSQPTSLQQPSRPLMTWPPVIFLIVLLSPSAQACLTLGLFCSFSLCPVGSSPQEPVWLTLLPPWSFCLMLVTFWMRPILITLPKF